MPTEPTLTPAEKDICAERGIIGLLLAESNRYPVSVEEIKRELGDYLSLSAIDAIERLRGEGLIHRCGEYVFATRAAFAAHRVSY
jgi:hypothetical protein